jgi:hypothetical protein
LRGLVDCRPGPRPPTSTADRDRETDCDREADRDEFVEKSLAIERREAAA